MSTRVSVIGCGMMGSALARALNAGGHVVSGFDLDSGRLDALQADGIESADSVEDAFSRSELVVINVPNYKAVDAVLASVSSRDAWEGSTVINLVSGTPEGARACCAAVTSNGAAYLDGAILAYPGNIGEEDAMILYSGPSKTWDKCEETLVSLGGASAHVAEDVGGASVLDVAMAGAFFTVSLAALAEAASYIRSQGLDLRASLAAARSEAVLLVAGLDEAIEAMASGNHATDQSTLDAFLEAAETWHHEMTESGQRAALMGATTANLKRAHDAGLGSLGFFAQIETLETVD